jgi:hypothetical protein
LDATASDEPAGAAAASAAADIAAFSLPGKCFKGQARSIII